MRAILTRLYFLELAVTGVARDLLRAAPPRPRDLLIVSLVALSIFVPVMPAPAQNAPVTAGVAAAPSLPWFDCSLPQFVGATLDVTLNQCWAAVLTNLGGVANASKITDASGLSESITSLVQTNQLLAPVLSKVASGTGSAYGSSATVTVSYAMTSPMGLSSSSSEASITVDGTCPGSGNCFVQMATPTYPGTATTYTPYYATSTGYAGLSCGAINIGSTQAFGSGACAGTAVSKANTNGQFILPQAATWTCNLTGAACIQPMDRSIWRSELSGSTGGMKIVSAGGTNLSDALVGTDRNAKNGAGVQDGGQTYTTLSGFQVSAGSGTVPIGLRWSAQADSSRLENLQIVNGVGTACFVYATGYAFAHNLHCDSNNGAGGSNLIVGKIGASATSFYADKLVLVHPSNTTSNLVYAGGNTNLVVAHLDIETNLTASCNGTVIDLGPSGTQLGTVVFGAITVGAICATSAATIVKIESNMNQVDIGELSTGAQSGVTPISDLRAAAVTATPYTNAQCSTASGQSGPCEYHVKRTPAFYATGLALPLIDDINFNEILGFTPTASAVDYVNVTDGAAGSPGTVTIAAKGSDTNINLNLVSKGSGAVQCNGSSCGTGGPGTGTQYTHPYWSSTSALGSVGPTTGYDGVPQQETNSTSGGVFTAAPVSAPQGVPVDIESGSTFTVALTDRSKVLNTTNNTTSTAVTVPAPSTTGFGFNFLFAHLNSGSVVATDTPTTATINGNSAMKLVGAVAGHNPEAAFWWEDSSTSCTSGPCYWGAEILPTDANGRLAAEGFGALTGDVTNAAGTYGTTVSKINGTAVPASAAVLGTNSSSQPIADTAHQMLAPLACSGSASTTAPTCTTTPSFTPASGDCINITWGATNTGALTLNVNSSSAAPVQKWLGTALASGDAPSGKTEQACYDGTNWQIGTIGNAPAAGSNPTVTDESANFTAAFGATPTTYLVSGTSANIRAALPNTVASTGQYIEIVNNSSYDVVAYPGTTAANGAALGTLLVGGYVAEIIGPGSSVKIMSDGATYGVIRHPGQVGLGQLGSRRVAEWLEPGNGTQIGFGDLVNTIGTASFDGSSPAAGIPALTIYTTTAVSGNNSAAVSSTAIYRTGRNIVRTFSWQLPDEASGLQRFVSGLSDSPNNVQANDTPTSANAAYIRYSSSASDTNWMCVSSAGGGTATATSTGKAIDANFHTGLVALYDTLPTPVQVCMIDGGSATINTALLPSASTNLAQFTEIVTLTTAARHVYTGGSRVESDQ